MCQSVWLLRRPHMVRGTIEPISADVHFQSVVQISGVLHLQSSDSLTLLLTSQLDMFYKFFCTHYFFSVEWWKTVVLVRKHCSRSNKPIPAEWAIIAYVVLLFLAGPDLAGGRPGAQPGA